MKALWWWIDRWQGSSAYKDMTLEEQGAYRNLLDECWLRDGGLPDDERLLARFCGAVEAWDRVRYAVMAHFAHDPMRHEWRHPTLDRVLHESKRKAANERKRRQRKAGLLESFGPPVRGADGRWHIAPSPATRPATAPAILPVDTVKTGHATGVSGSSRKESDSEQRAADRPGGLEPAGPPQEVGPGAVLAGGRRPHPRGACSDPLCCEQPARSRAAHA